MYIGIVIISVIFSGIGAILSRRLRSKFAKYSRIPTASNLSGAEVAKQMLDYYGVQGVQIMSSQGQLSDHYNPKNRTVNLSPDVYAGRNVSAAAVAAHEVGHAIQHATNYPMLAMRSNLVPAVQLASKAQQYIFMFAMVGAGLMESPLLIGLVLVTFGLTSLFSLVTLPVEFDASKRALVYLDESGIASGAQHEGAKDALFWAAMTYVAGALAALVQLLFLMAMMLGGSDD